MKKRDKNKKNGSTAMKRCLIRLFGVLFLVMAVTGVDAKSPRKSDYMVFGGNAGYGVLLGKTSDMKLTGGFSGGLHVGYEYREGTMWMSAGVEGTYFGSACASSIAVEDVFFSDTRKMMAKMKYTMLSQRTEMQRWMMGRIVVMVGYCTGNNNRDGFYVGGGVKLGGKFDLKNTSRIKYSTRAEYDRYIDDYEDMPNHYYSVRDRKDSVVFGTMFNVSVIAECGWDLKVDRCNRLKVGFFAEAGLNNIMDGVATRNAWVNESNVSEVKPYSAYNSEAMKDKYVVPFMVGMRVSFLFNVSRITSRCHTCPCFRKR